SSAQRWLLPKIFLWFPRLIAPYIRLPCPNIHCKGTNTQVHEWPQNPPARRVASLTETYYIMSRRYKCLDCEQRGDSRFTFMPYDSGVLSQLPEFLVSLFPALLSHRSGLDNVVINHMRTTFSDGWSPTKMARLLRENYHRDYHERYLRYLQFFSFKHHQ